jgi:hypothetical protein
MTNIVFILIIAVKKLHAERHFHKFCETMLKGVEVLMFGRKYGDLTKRKIYFDEDLLHFCYVVQGVQPKKHPLNEIYKVSTGVSGYPYEKARPTHKSWCFHLAKLGNLLVAVLFV